MEEENGPEFSDEEVAKMLRDVLKQRIEEKRKFPERVQLNKALVSVIGEFLSTYRVIGYDYEGQPVSLTIYRNPMDKSALDNQFLDEFSKFMAKRVG